MIAQTWDEFKKKNSGVVGGFTLFWGLGVRDLWGHYEEMRRERDEDMGERDALEITLSKVLGQRNEAQKEMADLRSAKPGLVVDDELVEVVAKAMLSRSYPGDIWEDIQERTQGWWCAAARAALDAIKDRVVEVGECAGYKDKDEHWRIQQRLEDCEEELSHAQIQLKVSAHRRDDYKHLLESRNSQCKDKAARIQALEIDALVLETEESQAATRIAALEAVLRETLPCKSCGFVPDPCKSVNVPALKVPCHDCRIKDKHIKALEGLLREIQDGVRAILTLIGPRMTPETQGELANGDLCDRIAHGDAAIAVLQEYRAWMHPGSIFSDTLNELLAYNNILDLITGEQEDARRAAQ